VHDFGAELFDELIGFVDVFSSARTEADVVKTDAILIESLAAAFLGSLANGKARAAANAVVRSSGPRTEGACCRKRASDRNRRP
jgi:hypothetical protein